MSFVMDAEDATCCALPTHAHVNPVVFDKHRLPQQIEEFRRLATSFTRTVKKQDLLCVQKLCVSTLGRKL